MKKRAGGPPSSQSSGGAATAAATGPSSPSVSAGGTDTTSSSSRQRSGGGQHTTRWPIAVAVLVILGFSVVFFMDFKPLPEPESLSALRLDDICVGDCNPYDVIVVGGGLAGLVATLEATKAGASRVLLIDREPQVGGNSAKASSGINAAGSKTQLLDPVAKGDTAEIFYEDTMKSGDFLSDKQLVSLLTATSKDAIQYLEELGVDLSKITQCGGHSFPRTHRSGPPKPGERAANIGWNIVSKVKAKVQTLEEVEIRTGARVTRLLNKQVDGTTVVVGVEYVDGKDPSAADGSNREWAASVVLTTGGYSADKDGFLKDEAPEIAHLPTTNGHFARGDGIRLGVHVGAVPIHLDKVQIHPTGFVNPKDPDAHTKILAAEALRGEGGILLTPRGERFVNELERRDRVTESIFRHCRLPGAAPEAQVYSYLMLNERAKQGFGGGINFYIGMGLFREYVNGKAFAEENGISLDTLTRSLSTYNEAARSKKKDAFGKTVFPVTFDIDEKLFVARITPVIHYTMGGLKMSSRSEILAESGAPIPGLFGAGEVTGGVHGGNRLAGNSLLECVIYGRVAGSTSAAYALSTK